MEEKREEIEISKELQSEMAHKFKVTERTIQSAMRFETNSPSARMFRSYAKHNGGKHCKITTIKITIDDYEPETILS